MEIVQKKKRGKIIWIILLTLLLVLSCVVYFRYYFVFSEGTRVGILYKFSKKGTIFKTFEGEMVLPGLKFKNQNANISSNMFYFSVSDEKVANELMSNQGYEIEMHYVFYNRPLPWRGDSYENEKGQYVVDKIIRIKNKNPNGYGL
jgi:flagellar basal body-associated protein FliL